MLRIGPSVSVSQQDFRAQAVIAPVADFTGTPLTGTTPLSVVFTDTSINGPLTAWHWEKNDGSGWVDFLVLLQYSILLRALLLELGRYE
jgi:PKD repeat protein